MSVLNRFLAIQLDYTVRCGPCYFVSSIVRQGRWYTRPLAIPVTSRRPHGNKPESCFVISVTFSHPLGRNRHGHIRRRPVTPSGAAMAVNGLFSDDDFALHRIFDFALHRILLVRRAGMPGRGLGMASEPPNHVHLTRPHPMATAFASAARSDRRRSHSQQGQGYEQVGQGDVGSEPRQKAFTIASGPIARHSVRTRFRRTRQRKVSWCVEAPQRGQHPHLESRQGPRAVCYLLVSPLLAMSLAPVDVQPDGDGARPLVYMPRRSAIAPRRLSHVENRSCYRAGRTAARDGFDDRLRHAYSAAVEKRAQWAQQ